MKKKINFKKITGIILLVIWTLAVINAFGYVSVYWPIPKYKILVITTLVLAIAGFYIADKLLISAKKFKRELFFEDIKNKKTITIHSFPENTEGSFIVSISAGKRGKIVAVTLSKNHFLDEKLKAGKFVKIDKKLIYLQY